MRALLIIGVLLVAGVAAVGVADVERTVDDAVRDLEPDKIDRDRARAAFQERLNDLRAEHYLGPVRQDTDLEDVANAHSGSMARADELEHGDTERRLRGAGCSGAFGENIAYTYIREEIGQEYGDIYVDSADDLARAIYLQWFHSPPHKDIMLSEGVDRMGLGLVVIDSGKVYATLNVC